ncbi:TlpA family protein disulfide reductase [Halobacteriales archaeon Cl-PHB]
MRRRDVLGGLAGLATVGGAAYLLGSTPGAATGVDPVELETVEAPGSSGHPITVPERGRPTLVEFFATWCHVCAESMPELRAAYADLGDDVQFVSVTNEPIPHSVSRDEVADWWRSHDGTWPVAVDADLDLTEKLDATGVPTVVVLDADNRITWKATGKHSASTLVDQVRAADGETA